LPNTIIIAPKIRVKSHINPSKIVETINAIRGIIIATYAASFEPNFLISVRYKLNPKTLPKIDK
jgi:hypothetical protein